MIERIDFSLNDFEEMRKFLEEDLSQYSKEGFRTLIIASKVLSRHEYKSLKRDYKIMNES